MTSGIEDSPSSRLPECGPGPWWPGGSGPHLALRLCGGTSARFGKTKKGGNMVNAIETNYGGCLFRSRLEARWAVFFDALKIEWLYEPEGFHISKYEDKKWMYLPDFLLPEFPLWVEVKGDIDGLTDEYCYMLSWSMDWGGQLPNVADSSGSARGLLLLGQIPKDGDRVPAHSILQHFKGLTINRCRFERGGNITTEKFSGDDFDSGWGALACGEVIKRAFKESGKLFKRFGLDEDEMVMAAYTKARKSRFGR